MHTLRVAQVEQRVAGCFGVSSAATGCNCNTGRCGTDEGAASLAEAVSIIGSFHAAGSTGTVERADTWRGTQCRIARRRRRRRATALRGMPDDDGKRPELPSGSEACISSCAIRRFVAIAESAEASPPAKSIDDETRVGMIIRRPPLRLSVCNADCRIDTVER
ncbi:putative lipoprotein [Burkholderia sp. ABCPW 111]|nr:putative lipoprotein [Burkholderia sp. ABCPW 111]